MQHLSISITGNTLTVDDYTPIPSGTVGATAKVTFGDDWAQYNKVLVWKSFNDFNPMAIPFYLQEGETVVPWEIVREIGSFKVGVYGMKEGVRRVALWSDELEILRGTTTYPQAPPPPTSAGYSKLLADVSTVLSRTNDLEAAVADTEAAKETAVISAEKAEEYAGAANDYLTGTVEARAAAEASAKTAKDAEKICTDAADAAALSEKNAAVSEENAKASEDAAKLSETNSKDSEEKASQAYEDFLNQLGTDVPTLVGGKIPMSQIPATATQEIYTVTSEDELTSLTAQRGDLAELIEEVGGEQTITKTWQCLGDSTVRDNWVVWGTSYAVSAGNATTAENAENANTINNHRLVEISAEEFETAVKDENTYYLVY